MITSTYSNIDIVMLNGGCDDVVFGVIVLFYAEEILEPNGMGGVVELFIVVMVKILILIGPGIPDQFSRDLLISYINSMPFVR